MQQVVQQGSGKTAKALKRPVAGKTGTSQENKSAWFAGFTPQLSTAVALFRGNEEHRGVPRRGGWSEHRDRWIVPTTIWTTFMQAALADEEVLDFPDPEWVGKTINPEPTREPEPTQPEQPQERGARNRSRVHAARRGHGDDPPIAVHAGPGRRPGGVAPTTGATAPRHYLPARPSTDATA